MARSFAPIAVVGLARMLGSGLAPAMLDCTSLTTYSCQVAWSIPDRSLSHTVGAPTETPTRRLAGVQAPDCTWNPHAHRQSTNQRSLSKTDRVDAHTGSHGGTFLAVTTPSTMEAKVLMVVGASCFFS